ncbi:hypothetical protein G6F55_009583 [Rhizopus delemar]|uniref:RING-type domain-containing protein n=2 Tax=Rhizopus TaxID=4842 RepID=A0A9P6YV50_9FUNG|nr:hypothetical protein G6F55_009583 [Rhizopus delemar]KAG1537185.1 hypothetical protein G6F51_010522 [Rhizopus arrhizus]KAG1520702.1 hypothetical protein G6F52_007420 [Rhizopus delemar]KAG1565171.1 hypothetical protein G6F50_010320 [Rhizopus delemar]KAG1624188.1 hypothetical protein G6F45_010260 [Rhizopus arrhizus]
MTWYNLLFRNNKPQKRPVSVDVDDRLESIPVCLKLSPLYDQHLVHIHTIVHHYMSLIMSGRKNKYDWILIQAFMRAWYSEMERVYEHVTSVADILRTQIEELSNALCDADIRESCCEKESIKSMHSRFQHHHRHLENRIQFMLNEKHSTPLSQCMQRVYRLGQAILLYEYYIESQMKLLKDISHIIQSPSVLSYWTQKHSESQEMHKQLLDQLRCLLEQQLPCQQDMTCSICLSILHEPVTLKGCHHTFCKDCLQQHYCYTCFFRKKKRVWTKTPLIDCTCFVLDATNQIVPAHDHQPCPLCRRLFSPQDCKLDLDLDKFIRAYVKMNEKKKDKMWILQKGKECYFLM